MKKVVKFGGSSLASAEQFRKTAAIIHADESRVYVVPSAPGKRFPDDTKVTDLLIRAFEEAEAGRDFSATLAAIRGRYEEIVNGLGLCNDHEFYSDSIIYQHDKTKYSLSDVDWIMLNYLYSPLLSPGDRWPEAERKLSELYGL